MRRNSRHQADSSQFQIHATNFNRLVRVNSDRRHAMLYTGGNNSGNKHQLQRILCSVQRAAIISSMQRQNCPQLRRLTSCGVRLDHFRPTDRTAGCRTKRRVMSAAAYRMTSANCRCKRSLILSKDISHSCLLEKRNSRTQSKRSEYCARR